jgi:dsRNA-specific ribonuclease
MINLVCAAVNGAEKGKGMGKSQKIAKEEAARHAYFTMGWNS